ncbi:hypothetical protein [Acidisphaera sp. L21]|uniref:hypothetical protein n=1 Tax=Acidisphaera sp. L21 TaxID=1641851 RepID=UPI00131AF611|nr:hypothetical protein [Acidisphaera sp. L21]
MIRAILVATLALAAPALGQTPRTPGPTADPATTNTTPPAKPSATDASGLPAKTVPATPAARVDTPPEVVAPK